MSVKEQIVAELDRLSLDELADVLQSVRLRAQAKSEGCLRVLSEIDVRSHLMNPASDTLDRVRDARAGAMFGE